MQMVRPLMTVTVMNVDGFTKAEILKKLDLRCIFEFLYVIGGSAQLTHISHANNVMLRQDTGRRCMVEQEIHTSS